MRVYRVFYKLPPAKLIRCSVQCCHCCDHLLNLVDTILLQDPKQKRLFSADELGDLFTLGDDGSVDGFTDTVDLFQVGSLLR